MRQNWITFELLHQALIDRAEVALPSKKDILKKSNLNSFP